MALRWIFYLKKEHTGGRDDDFLFFAFELKSILEASGAAKYNWDREMFREEGPGFANLVMLKDFMAG